MFLPVTSSTNIVIDIWILILPIKLLLSIRRPGREKLALLGIFTLGTFSCIASIVRLYSVRVYTEVRIQHFRIKMCRNSLKSIPSNLTTHHRKSTSQLHTIHPTSHLNAQTHPQQSSDPFYDTVPINTWSMVEVHLGIWCASIPSLKALGSRKEFERKRLQQSNGYPFHGSRGNRGNGNTGMVVGKEDFMMETVDIGGVESTERIVGTDA